MEIQAQSCEQPVVWHGAVAMEGFPEHANGNTISSDLVPGSLDHTFEISSTCRMPKGMVAGRLQDNMQFRHTVAIPEVKHWPIHVPTMLIEYWFRHICPLRSTFDSSINYNRRVAWNTWSTSDAVFQTMQAMAAACLVRQNPQLREVLPSLKLQALTAVRSGISQAQGRTTPFVKADLIFAIISLGTSLHWFAPASPSGPERSWLRSAHGLLRLWKQRLAASEQLLFSYFSQALTYWDMLLAPQGRGSFPIEMRTKRQLVRQRLKDNLDLPMNNSTTGNEPTGENVEDFLGTRPNSWCGVSSEVIYRYGQVLALCHSVSIRAANIGDSATEKAFDTLCDLSIARELQKELLAMNFDILVLLEEAQGFPVHTQDSKTPLLHLLQTAEGFRIAGLLQLHLIFKELPVLHVFPGSDSFEHRGDTCHLSRKHLIFTLAMNLLNILEDVPITSGCKSIHPMLYLAVAVGLCNTAGSTLKDAYPGTTDEGPIDFSKDSLQMSQRPKPFCLSAATKSLIDKSVCKPSSGGLQSVCDSLSPISQLTMEVSKARMMTLSHLSTLQQMLPYASSGQVLRVTNAVWAAYDDRQGDDENQICWFTILKAISPDVLLWS